MPRERDTSEIGSVKFCIVILTIFVSAISLSLFNTSCNECLHVFKDDGVQLDLNSIRKDLKYVCDHGPHYAGSSLLETNITNYMIDQIKSRILKDAQNHVQLSVHVSGPGSFNIGPLIKTYDSIRNVVVRISEAPTEKRKALLLNCHFDSAIGSPGASDVFISCAIMLEIGRIFATKKFSMKNDLILLFNNAEESLLIGSHAFITQHLWSKDVAAFLNLEGAGTGGRAYLFQTGPGEASEFLMNAYAKAIVRPAASALAQDLFHSGLIPSDTDFRIFRDYGLIPGLDMAYTTEGYHYHTPYDSEDRITDRCTMLAAANLFSLSKILLQDPSLPNIPKPTLHKDAANWSSTDARKSKVSEKPSIVFQDMFSMFTIVYPTWVEKAIHIALICLFIYLVVFHRFHVRILICNFFILIGWIFSCVTINILIAFFMHTYSIRLSFYNFRFNAIVLYTTPLVLITIVYFTIVINFLFRNNEQKCIEKQRVHDYLFLAYTLFNLIVSSILIFVGITVNFIQFSFFLIFLFFFSVKVFTYFNIWQITAAYPLMLLISSAFGLNTLIPLIDTFIPILGRTGNMFPPDMILAFIIALAFVSSGVCVSNFVVQTSYKTKKFVSIFLFQMILNYYLLIYFTKLGFPYGETKLSYQPNDYPLSYRYQRFRVYHIDRYLTYPNGSFKNDSGIMLDALDSNGFRYLKPQSEITYSQKIRNYFNNDPSLYAFKDIEILDEFNCDNEQPYCGVSRNWALGPVPESYFVPTQEKINSFPVPSFDVETVPISNNIFNLTFKIKIAHAHTVVNFRVPVNELSIEKCSFDLSGSKIQPITISNINKTAEHYFISHLNPSYILKDNKTQSLNWEFWITILKKKEVISNLGMSISTAVFDDKFIYGTSNSLKKILKNLPKWTSNIFWTATYRSYIISL